MYCARLLVRLLVRLGDVHGALQEDTRHGAFVVALLPCVTEEVELARHVVVRVEVLSDVVVVVRRPAHRLVGVHGGPDRRMRLLVGLRVRQGLLEVEVLAVVRDLGLRPGLLDH